MVIDRDSILSKIYESFGSTNPVKPRVLKKWLKKLIDINDPEAILIMSVMQSNKMSDDCYAVYRYGLVEKSANLGFPPAISNLAELYYNDGNYEKAYFLYERAAALGESHALKVLAIAYKLGLHGYEKNLELAEKYAKNSKSAKCWDPFSGYNATENIFDEPSL